MIETYFRIDVIVPWPYRVFDFGFSFGCSADLSRVYSLKFLHRPWQNGRQSIHTLPNYLHEQFIERALALHRQQMSILYESMATRSVFLLPPQHTPFNTMFRVLAQEFPIVQRFKGYHCTGPRRVWQTHKQLRDNIRAPPSTI